MEVFSLENLYNLALDLVDKIKSETYNPKDLIVFIRKNTSKNLLNSYCIAGKLDKFEMDILKTDISSVKFSLDNIIKNIVNHPELNIDDYKKINKIISYPDEVIYSKTKNNCILILKKYDKKYQIVIKSTLNLKENFLTSFRYAEH